MIPDDSVSYSNAAPLVISAEGQELMSKVVDTLGSKVTKKLKMHYKAKSVMFNGKIPSQVG